MGSSFVGVAGGGNSSYYSSDEDNEQGGINDRCVGPCSVISLGGTCSVNAVLIALHRLPPGRLACLRGLLFASTILLLLLLTFLFSFVVGFVLALVAVHACAGSWPTCVLWAMERYRLGARLTTGG